MCVTVTIMCVTVAIMCVTVTIMCVTVTIMCVTITSLPMKGSQGAPGDVGPDGEQGDQVS